MTCFRRKTIVLVTSPVPAWRRQTTLKITDLLNF
jgi:hypothetical protein